MLGGSLRSAVEGRGQQTLQLVRHPASGPSQLQWNPAAERPFASVNALEGLSSAVHLSGASVAAKRWTGRGDELLDETSPLGTGFLADLCRAWEAAAQPAVEAGIRVVHMRFGVVLGREGGALRKMLPLFRLGLGGRLGPGSQWMSWIGLEDAVASIKFALDTPTIAGAVNATAPEPVTNAAFTRVLARTVHRFAVIPAPALGLRVAFGQMADEALLSSTRAVPSRLLTAGFKFAHPALEGELRSALA
jgi:uncharacterized protein (TIGR01777 family)